MSEKSDLMKEYAELTRKRSSFKGQVTIFIGYLKSLGPPSAKDIGELELRLNRLESLYAQYDKAQTRLECIAENIDQQLLEREEFDNRYYKTMSQAREMLANCKGTLVPLPTDCESRIAKLNPVKLPTIQIPKFTGSFNNWLEFRDTFASLIHENDDIDDVNKFHYLRTSLEGSAAVVISSIEFSSRNYSVAWNLLCDRFDNKRLLIQHHVAALFNIEPVTRESASNLKNLMDQFNKNIRALDSLGEPTQHWDTLLLHIISNKLDSKTYREWEEYKGRLGLDTRVGLQHFIEFMRIRTNLLDTIEFSRHSHQVTHNKQSKVKAMVTTQSKSSTLISKDSCPKCSGEHRLNNCPQFLALSNDARLQLLPTLKVCFNCFSKSHFSNNCKKQGCKICKRKHSVLVHITDKKPVVHGERTDHIGATPSTDSSNLTLASVSPASLEPNPNIPDWPYVIGLAGGIASGKSNIAEKLRLKGAAVVNCDIIAHEMYKPGLPLNSTIAKEFGKSIITETGEVDRRKLGQIVFSDKEQLEKLNRIVWPAVIEETQRRIRALGQEGYRVVVMEAAVMVRAQWYHYCHQLWCVIIPPAEAIKRLQARNNLSEEEAKQRVEAQPSNLEQVARANVVFSPYWSYEYTGGQIDRAWDHLREYLNSRNSKI